MAVLNFETKRRLYEWMKLNREKINERRLRTYQVAGLASEELGFPVTRSHVSSLAHSLGIKFSVAPQPGEKRGAAKGTDHDAPVEELAKRKPTVILARALLKLAGELGVDLGDGVRQIVKRG